MEPQLEELIIELYETMSLRKVRDELRSRGHTISHQTVASALHRRGKIRSRSEASARRKLYPRPWTCKSCGLERMAENHKEYRRESCSDLCANELRRTSAQ